MDTLDDLVARWPTAAEFARDIGVKPNHLQTMLVRRSLPTDYWEHAIAAAKRRRISGVTWGTLNAMRRSLRAAS